MLRLDWNLLFTILNLLIWYILIRKFLFKPINRVIDQREERLAARGAEAQKLMEEAQKEKDEYAKLQAQIEEEKTAALADARERAQAEYDQIIKEAGEKADKLAEESRKQADRQRAKLLEEAGAQIRDMIREAASEAMQSGTDNAALYDQFLTKAGETDHAE